MPIQLRLAIFADNEFASKRLITLLYRLGFAVSYDEVSLFVCLLVIFSREMKDIDKIKYP